MFMIAPLDLHFSILYDVLKKHVAEDADYKVSFISKLRTYILWIMDVSLLFNFTGDYILHYCDGYQTCR